MPLMAHVTPRIEVPLIGKNTVSVRGFNLDDFLALLPNHLEGLSKMAALYAQHKTSVFSGRAFQDFMLAAARDFPGLVMEVISIAADEPEAVSKKLSTGLQISVLTAIAKLTIEEAGGLGNLFAQLREIGRQVLVAQAELGDNDGSPKPPPFNSSSGNGGSKSTS